MQAALRARLIANGGLSALVGSRIYWVNRPANSALPAIRLQTISDPREETLTGYRDLRETRVQCDCFALTYAESRSLAGLVVTALEPAALNNAVQFGRTSAEGPRDLGEDTTAGYIFRASVDLLVRHYSA